MPYFFRELGVLPPLWSSAAMNPRPSLIFSSCSWFMFRSNQPTLFSVDRCGTPYRLPVRGRLRQLTQGTLEGHRRPLDLAGRHNHVGDHLGAALRAPGAAEESAPDPTDDHHLLVDVAVGGRRRRREPHDRHALGPAGLCRPRVLVGDLPVARRQLTAFSW